MRMVGCGLVIAGALGALGIEACLAEALSSPVRTEVSHFDVFVGNRKVGHMRLKVMVVKDLVILDEEFVAPFKVKGKSEEAGFDSQVVFRGTAKPTPQRGKLTTRLGSFKLMDGSVEFTSSGGEMTAKAQSNGYADAERNPFETPRTWEKELPVPGDLVLTHAAMLHYGPRLLTKPGKIENVTHMKFPGDIPWPRLVEFQPDCVLERHPTTLEGAADITLHRVFAGGNIIPLVRMTVTTEGQVVEMNLGKFTIRPASLPGDEKPSPQ